MTATGTFDDGSTSNVTSQSSWQSSDTTVATVGPNNGLVKAATTIASPPGVTTITATDGAFTNTATVTVCPIVTSITITPSTTAGGRGADHLHRQCGFFRHSEPTGCHQPGDVDYFKHGGDSINLIRSGHRELIGFRALHDSYSQLVRRHQPGGYNYGSRVNLRPDTLLVSMTAIQCIGICTGGGDAPGLNAVIRAAVKAAILKYKWKVIGIPDGFDGLIWPEKSVPTYAQGRQRHSASRRHHPRHHQSRQSFQILHHRRR